MCNATKQARLTFSVPDEETAARLEKLKQQPEFAGGTWSSMLGLLVALGASAYIADRADKSTN